MRPAQRSDSPFFLGEHRGRLDAKGRILLPSKFKSLLTLSYPVSDDSHGHGSEVVLRMGFESHLVIYLACVYQKMHQKMVELSDFDSENRTLKRNFFRNTFQVSLDSLGRVRLTKPMLRYAALKKEVVMVGIGQALEIWSSEKYEEFVKKDEKIYADLAQRILEK